MIRRFSDTLLNFTLCEFIASLTGFLLVASGLLTLFLGLTPLFSTHPATGFTASFVTNIERVVFRQAFFALIAFIREWFIVFSSLALNAGAREGIRKFWHSHPHIVNMASVANL